MQVHQWQTGGKAGFKPGGTAHLPQRVHAPGGGPCRGQGAYLVAVPVLVPQPLSRWPVLLLVLVLVLVACPGVVPSPR